VGFESPLEHVRQTFFVSWAMRGEQMNETNVVCGNTGSCFIPSLGSRFMPKNRHKVRKAGLQPRLPKDCDSAIMLRGEGKVLQELIDKIGLWSGASLPTEDKLGVGHKIERDLVGRPTRRKDCHHRAPGAVRLLFF